jgi:methylmalonyl-CoA mutase N-terminal domain/subunit
MGRLFEAKEIARIAAQKKDWERALGEELTAVPLPKGGFKTVSGREVEALYAPSDTEGFDYGKRLGFPGCYPYTRGVHGSMYRGRLWTMRMFAGLGSAEETNKRFHYLVRHGQTGLSTAFDMPTLMGYDTGNGKARGECGICGVAIDTLKDMEILFQGLPVDQLTTSMTINPPAPVLWAMYIAMAEKRGIPRERLGGTIQNDMLKEFMAQKTFMCPPEPSVRLIVDTMEFGSQQVPRWNTISISGYHIREAGSTAVQELAFTLADGIAYVEAALERGLPIDAFAPRLSFFFNAHIDFFEEIAKYRAARRMWANIMKNRFKAKEKRSMWLRFHTQTAGCSLTAAQPFNNVVRTAVEALAALLGGTQSLHTNSFDEVHAIPTEEAASIALRTQQILAEETGIRNTIDPLGGSYLIEALTDEMEEAAYAYIEAIDAMGGMVKAIERNYPQMEIADAAYRFQKELDEKKKIMVGVNKYEEKDEIPVDTYHVEEDLEDRQIARTNRVKEGRDQKRVEACLERLGEACSNNENAMPHLIEGASAYCTLQEMCDVFRKVFGTYEDPGTF